MALGRSHACQRKCLVVGMGLGEGWQQKPVGLVGAQCFDNAFDQWWCMAQAAVCKIPADGRLQAHDARRLVRFCKSWVAGCRGMPGQGRLQTLLASSDNDGVYAQALALCQHEKPCATEHFIIGVRGKAKHAVVGYQRNTAVVVVWRVKGSVKHGLYCRSSPVYAGADRRAAFVPGMGVARLAGVLSVRE